VTLPPFAAAVAEAAAILDRLRIRYLVGGSVATLVHGEPRNTQDVDLVIEIDRSRADELAAALQAQFFANPEFLHLALRERIAFNAVHRTTGLKLDFFILSDRPYGRIEMDRATHESIAPGCTIRVATAEDCVLTKLDWYRKGDEVSDRQWRDVQGVLKVQRERLDLHYMHRWAPELGVADLLERALRDAGFP
jgi:hypothetical protein